ncbi:hypothetical protein [Variovorax sp. J31P207]|uniref:hypothetical protein n=1 Tax=Variovorax sp. J31P207 TaxID=3053510 RepID=UPI002574BC30|nr:hypothetical protein [Variovorax sp. J31P207]MDM0069168.1 hypothetical protein [Variovorax sp. J31P207]
MLAQRNAVRAVTCLKGVVMVTSFRALGAFALVLVVCFASAGILAPNTALLPGQAISSDNGRYVLVMQGDGNLVYYRTSDWTPRWNSQTQSPGAFAPMQGDGNLVVYDANGVPLWASQTSGNPGAYLAAQDDGNLVIYGGGRALWNIGSDAQPISRWALVNTNEFRLGSDPAIALTRSQGIAFNMQSNSIAFSGRTGLNTTDLNFNSIKSNTVAITSAIHSTYRSDHIGCIDVYQGQIFVPLEDEVTGYQHPAIATYDANNLSFTGQIAALPLDVDQSDGVPWVAVDSGRQMVYAMKYQNATKLNMFTLSSVWNGVPVRTQLNLSQPLSLVQCGKVSGNYLFTFGNDPQMTVNMIDLKTGTVTPVLHLADYVGQASTSHRFWEAEGLAFFTDGNGASLHLTAISSESVLGFSTRARLTVFNFKQQ